MHEFLLGFLGDKMPHARTILRLPHFTFFAVTPIMKIASTVIASIDLSDKPIANAFNVTLIHRDY
jgi:hypothetical protein